MGEFIISVIQLVISILLIPLTYVFVVEFFGRLSGYPLGYGQIFLNGGITFSFMFLFLYQFAGVYEFGKKIVEGMFSLVAPLDGVLSRVFSLFLVILLPAFFISNRVMKIKNFNTFFLFAAGFCFVMQILLSAQDLQSEDTSIIKPKYMLLFNIIIIVNVLMVVFALDLALERSGSLGFVRMSWLSALRIYRMCLGRLAA